MFAEEGDEFGLDVGEGGLEALLLVNDADGGFNAGGVTEGTEEFVGGEFREPFAVHAFAFLEDEVASEEGENGVAEPCVFALDFDGVLFGAHGWLSGAGVASGMAEVESVGAGDGAAGAGVAGAAGGLSFRRSWFSASPSQYPGWSCMKTEV